MSVYAIAEVLTIAYVDLTTRPNCDVRCKEPWFHMELDVWFLKGIKASSSALVYYETVSWFHQELNFPKLVPYRAIYIAYFVVPKGTKIAYCRFFIETTARQKQCMHYA
jgi:hypothetical protein